jgi:hypothetical protein
MPTCLQSLQRTPWQHLCRVGAVIAFAWGTPAYTENGPGKTPLSAEMQARVNVLDQQARNALKSGGIGAAVSLYVQMIDLGSKKGVDGICDIEDHFRYFPENGSIPCVVAGVRLDKVQKALAKEEADRQMELREETKRQEIARQEAARAEADRQQEAARQKAAADEATRQDAAQREEAAREEAAQRKAALTEAIRRTARILEIRACREHCESLHTHCDGPVEQAICNSKISACEADCS